MKNHKNYNLTIGILALLTIIIVFAVVGYIISKPKPRLICGEAEATEYRVSGKVPGRIEDLYYKEGDYVNKGDTLVFISSPEIKAKLAQAMAAKNAAIAQSEKAQNGARKEQITAAYELWQQAKIQEDVMKKSFNRIENLYKQKVVTAQKYDEVKAKYEASVAQTKAAKSQYDMALSGARKEDKKAAQALVDKANGAIEEVEAYLSELYLTAPASGIISNIFSKAGELVGTGAPIMTITDLKDVWFTFNIREDNLHSMQQNDTITVYIPALDNKEYKAVVNYIAVRESYATWRATKESDMYDAKTFEVRAVPTQYIEGIRPGMTVVIKRK